MNKLSTKLPINPVSFIKISTVMDIHAKIKSILCQRSGVVDPYSFRVQVARVRSRPRVAASGRLVPQLNDHSTSSSRGCGGVGVGHLATHFLLDQQILLLNELACL